MVDASCTVSPEFADCMAALITFCSSEPVGLKEVPGPTSIISAEQLAEERRIKKSNEIKKVVNLILITNLSMVVLSYIL